MNEDSYSAYRKANDEYLKYLDVHFPWKNKRNVLGDRRVDYYTRKELRRLMDTVTTKRKVWERSL